MNWCYIACFIDTDGSVGIYTVKEKYHYVHIHFYNNDKNVLKMIKKFVGFDGKISGRKNSFGHYKSKRRYQLNITNDELCKKILENCIPFMIIKKDKAIECLKFLSSSQD